jgi:outer membrane protein insertion porin family
MKLLLKTLILYFILISISYSEIVKGVTITGNERISEETIKVYGAIEDGKTNYSKQDLDIILKNIYETNFFKNVSIEIKNQFLIIDLEEYPVINQLVLLGEKANRIKEQIKKIINSKEKGSFIQTNLRDDINTIKSLYSSIGYNFTEVNAKVKEIDEKNLDLIFEIDRGEITRISKISFLGDKKIKEKRLRDIIASEENKFWKFITRNTRFSENLINLDKRLLINYYRSIGYYDVKVTSNSVQVQDTENVNLVYTIDAGQRYTIKKITTNVDSVFNKKLFFPLEKIYNKYIGDYYSPFKIKKILDEIDLLVESNNLQFVEHEVQEIIENDEILLSFNIREGEKVLVERINILGNNVTNENVIRSELLVDEGDPLTEISLNKSIAKIKSRNIFKSVNSEIKNGSKNNLKVIDIKVEERPTGEISAGAGIGTNGGSFAINVSENNWLGEGKRVNFELEISADSMKGQINYQNPNYDLLGNSLNYNLTNVTNDKPDQGYENKLFSTGVSTSFEQFKNIYTSLGLDLSYDDLRTTNTASSSLKKQEGEFVELAGNYGFSYDQRDRVFMPTSGSIVRFNQVLPFVADKPYIGNTFSSSSYSTINENVVGAAKFYLSAINGLDDENVRLSKRKSLSTSRLRGFEKGKVGPVDTNDHIGGNYAAAFNLEANLPNLLPESTNTDVSVFFDAGNVWGVDYDDTINESNKLRSSTGFSASWISPLGPMTFIFAQNLTKASTDKTEFFNFNLGASF